MWKLNDVVKSNLNDGGDVSLLSCFVISHLKAKRNQFPLVFAIFREELKWKFLMFSQDFASYFSLQYEAKK